MNFTAEQQQAISREGTNIIVSAGAGSGKTAVLSERVMRKVKDGVDIRDILILTFTNEAAAEMKNRIRKKLTKAGLVEQLEYLDAAFITTFDAFSLSIVKNYHYVLGVSKNIQIVDSSIIHLKKEQLLDEIFLDFYQKKDQNFLKLVDDFTVRDDDNLKQAILGLNDALDLKYDKNEYLEHYLTTFYQEEIFHSFLEEYFHILKEKCSIIENDVYALEGLLDEKLYRKVYDAYSVFFAPKTYDDLAKIKDIPTIQFRGIPEEAIPIKENLKDTIKELLELIRYSSVELKEQFFSTKNYVDAIIRIILELDKRLTLYKQEQSSFEFHDIAKMAIFLVKEHEDIRKEFLYNEILIDEYQDTSDLQEMFISTIEHDNVYMVGDIKQSIYRFRNANPFIFKNKYDKYSKHNGGEVINLLKNFRSRSEVLNNINTIFELIMNEEYGGVDYQKNHAMVYGNMTYSNEGKTSDNHNMEFMCYNAEESDFTKVEIEAFAIARDILSKVHHHYQVFDSELNTCRDIKYSDFCIILDRNTDMATIKKIFEYLNISINVYKDENLVLETDLAILKNILTFILSIYYKDYGTDFRYSFVSIARSFLGNMSDEEILVRIEENTIFETSIFKISQKLSKNLELKTPNILLKEIIDEFHYYEKLILVGHVKDAITRIHYLLDLSLNSENLGFTIEDFRDYIRDMIDQKKEIRYKEANEADDSVKIMNIHKSKGLEFPVCYFALLTKTFNLQDLNRRFLYDKKYGIITPYFNEGIGTIFTKVLMKEHYYQEEIGEKIRLFYVALTRAKEKMIFVLPEFSEEKKVIGRVDDFTASKYRSFYHFLASISSHLKPYRTVLNLDDLNLTHDYEYSKIKQKELSSHCDQKVEVRNLDISYEEIEEHHASKTIEKILTPQDEKLLQFGTSMHEMLEYTDFNDESIHNEYVDHLRETFDFKNASIYQELEFLFEDEHTEYHGIIDLMLEFPDKIQIIDYKLKNIEDDAYIKQLSVYYQYIRSISDKPIELYLYSIMDNYVKEIEYQME